MNGLCYFFFFNLIYFLFEKEREKEQREKQTSLLNKDSFLDSRIMTGAKGRCLTD